MSANSRNMNIRCESPEHLIALRDEYQDYVGRDTQWDMSTLTLTVLALPKKYKKKTLMENKIRRQRQARDSAFVDYDEYENDYEDRAY